MIEGTNVLVIDSHPLQDSRIGRHIQYMIQKEIEVFHINYNFYDPETDHAKLHYDERTWQINLFNKFNHHKGIIRRFSNTKYLFGDKIAKDNINIFNDIAIEPHQPLIIHVHDPILLPLASNLAKRFESCKVIYDRHELYEKCQKDSGINIPRVLERMARKSISGVIVVSESHINETSRLFHGVPIFAIPNYPSINDYDMDIIKKKIESVDANSRVMMSYIGSLDNSFDRDIDLTLKIATTAIKEGRAQFIMGGRSPGPQFDKLMRDYVQKFNDNFQFLGYVPRDQTIELTERSHIGFLFIKPNTCYWVKCSPNKVFEYLICGVVPVIRADVDVAQEIKNCALIFDRQAQNKEIIDEVIRLISDRERLMEIMMKASQLGLKFTFESVAGRYIDMYRSVFA